ncbi:SDR family oxidoreductase [Facklamia sp. 7083-14-GEN3]|uniref:SDR family oxidoreductase n=1 Tax=Facklamia sp. 7083-14-GEN3 TaxID=2973478 RepID=UPI00215C0C04|nr:SDR family oxidoreductase [Facklamia sp. 7083-14-GEN3]MCR8969393.1 SDR family oxidoreductase [Facklamia sp. 7083-14-GEN3]
MKKTKHIVITGAGSGLGATLAKKYNEKGYHVSLIGRTREKLEKLVQSFSNSSYSIYALDVSIFEDVKSTFDQIVKDNGPVDILINNAGVGYFDLAEKITLNQINQMIDINLKGTIFCSQQVLSSMKERNVGSIINVVSTAGLEGKITESVYCASKFGVKGFTESILKEVADTKLHIHGIYMGGMNTHFWGDELQDEKETGLMSPDDIADIIIFNTELRKNINIPEITIKNH